MTRSIILFTLMIATVASANDHDLQLTNFTGRNDQNVWTYSVMHPKLAKPLVVRLEIPRAAYVKQVSQTTESANQKTQAKSKTKSANQKTQAKPKMEYSMRQKRSTGGTLRLEFTQLNTQNRTITFEVIAPKRVTKNGEITWIIETSPKETKGTAPGPIGLDDPNIRTVITAAGRWRDSYLSTINTGDKTILLNNDGHLQTSLSAGLALNFLNWNNKFALDLLLSLEFGADSTKVIDGVICGLTFRTLRLRMFKLPEVFVGVSFRTEQGLRSIFKEKAKNLVMDIKKLPDTEENKKIKSDFKRFKKLKDNEDFDGFSTTNPITGEEIFPGPPLVEDMNLACVFGVAVPTALISGIADWIKAQLSK